MTLFGTAGIRGAVGDTVTADLAVAVGRAVGRTAGAPGSAVTVVVGRDGRVTGAALADGIAAGVESAGGHVVRIGQVPTPALAAASMGRYGVMITASHNPPEDNGFKLFVDGREFDSDAEQAVADAVADEPAPTSWEQWGDHSRRNTLPAYRAMVTTYARQYGDSLAGHRFAVDCGNGTGGRATPQVLRALGAEVIALDASVDGTFPSRPSKPTAETLDGLCRFVADAAGTAEAFTLGFAHDGDADRLVVVDEYGDLVHEDTVVAILAHHYVHASDVTEPVVITTPNASTRIDERVTAAGGRVERVPLGGLHEGLAAIDGPVVFAAEPWKHLHPELGPWIDGVASAAVVARLVAAVGRAALVDPVPARPARKTSVECPDERKAAAMDRLRSTLPDTYPAAEVETTYGLRLVWPESWVLVRPSGTEPYLRIYAESADVDELIDAVRETVKTAIDEAG